MLREQLSQSERKVEALAENTGLTIANCSQQLRRAALPEWREDARPMVMVSP
jgi:ArsR family transcriptional regulator